MFSKKSYPNESDAMPIEYPRDLGKWMTCMREVYAKMHLGHSKSEVIDALTKDWPVKEKLDFISWMKFYQEGSHMKYKTAQAQYYQNDDIPGYFLPINKKQEPTNIVGGKVDTSGTETLQKLENERLEKERNAERAEAIENHKRKIMGRLDSAERLLCSRDGRELVGEEFANILTSIHNLKLKIQTLSKVTASDSTYVDMIIREANKLASVGQIKSHAFLIKVAQGMQTLPAMPQMPTTGPVGTPDVGNQSGMSKIDGGTLGNNNPNPGALSGPPDALVPPAPPGADPLATLPANGKGDKAESGMKEFFSLLNGTPEAGEAGDSNKVDDELEVDENDLNDIDVYDEDVNNLVSEAQMAPPMEEPKPQGTPPAPEQKTEKAQVGQPAISPAPVADQIEGVPAGEPSTNQTDFDLLIDKAFGNVKIADVVSKLEELGNVFKNREIGRQLAIIDLMLDRMGLASFFPALAEATKSALESNQYCLTRVEDVLSKLRGSVNQGDSALDVGETRSPAEIKGKSLIDDESPTNISPEAEQVRNNLESQMNKDKKRKDLKKNLEDQALDMAIQNQQPGPSAGPEDQSLNQPAEIVPPANLPK